MSTQLLTQDNESLAVLMSSLPDDERKKLLDDLTDEQLEALLYDWSFWARPNQLSPPGDWRTWLVMAGRGWGKTRTGAEWIQEMSNHCGRLALVAATAGDARDTMVEGESGILAIAPPWNLPNYEPSKRRLTWPNGARATTFSADEPNRLRGPQHEVAWADELAAWKYPEAWDMLMFGLRLGTNPRVVVTTTPKPLKILRELIKDSTTVLTGGSTYENIDNLAPAFIDQIVKKYEGTRLGLQELYARLLEDIPGALWKRKQLDELRVSKHPELIRIVVAIDPATTSGEDSDETGIVVAGLGVDKQGYVLADLTCRESPGEWARLAVSAYYGHSADRIIGETNNGGDMIEHTVHTVDKSVAYKGVHASRGKRTRAEPIAALYEQGRVHHVGTFADLEDQMCMFTPDIEKSPDRVDALVWALTELMITPNQAATAAATTVSRKKLEEIFN